MLILGIFIGSFIGYITCGLLSQNRTSESYIKDDSTSLCKYSKEYKCLARECRMENPRICEWAVSET